MNLIIRILGNDLSGLHGSNQTITNLKFTLQHEPKFSDTDKVFLLNRIYDLNKKKIIIKLLEEYNIKYLDLPFKLEEFRKIPYDNTVNQKILKTPNVKEDKNIFKALRKYNLYLVNNNGSRNYCLEYGKKNGYRWTFVLDSNAFLTQKLYDNIFQNLKSETQYIILPQLRLSDMKKTNSFLLDYKGDYSEFRKREPQIVFRNDSTMNFNDKIPYGCSPKAELLRVLKVPGMWNTWNDNVKYYNIPDRKKVNVPFQKISYVIRLNSQFIGKKNNFNARIVGINNLVNQINKENPIMENFNYGKINKNNLKNHSKIYILVILLIILVSIYIYLLN